MKRAFQQPSRVYVKRRRTLESEHFESVDQLAVEPLFAETSVLRSLASNHTGNNSPHSDAKCCLQPILESLVDLMNENMNKPYLLCGGIRVLAAYGPLSISPSLYVQSFVDAMKTHPDNNVIHFEACRGLLHWMRIDPDILREVGTEVHLQFFTNLVHQRNGVAFFRYFVMAFLQMLIESSTDTLNRIGSKRGIVVSLLNLLKTNIQDPRTQQIGLSVLSYFLEANSSQEILLENDCISYLLHVMEIHENDEVVQCNASATLCWLVHSHRREPSTSFDHNGIAMCISTMTKFLHNQMVFGNFLCVLAGALLNNELTRTNFPREKATKLALQGMKIHMHSTKVQRNALTLIRIMLMDIDDDLDSIVLKNIGIVKEAMSAHPDEAAIQAEACYLLAHVASKQSAVPVLLKASIMEEVLKCQLRYRRNSRVQHAAIFFQGCVLQEGNVSGQQAFGGNFQLLGAIALLGISDRGDIEQHTEMNS